MGVEKVETVKDFRHFRYAEEVEEAESSKTKYPMLKFYAGFTRVVGVLLIAASVINFLAFLVDRDRHNLERGLIVVAAIIVGIALIALRDFVRLKLDSAEELSEQTKLLRKIAAGMTQK